LNSVVAVAANAGSVLPMTEYFLCLVTSTGKGSANLLGINTKWRDFCSLGDERRPCRYLLFLLFKPSLKLRLFRLYSKTLGNILPMWREYFSLLSIGNCRLLPYILWGGDPVVPDIDLDEKSGMQRGIAECDEKMLSSGLRNISPDFQGWLHKNFNSSQLKAIIVASRSAGNAVGDHSTDLLDNRLDEVQQFRCQAPITLIQGPPGTGKTSTVLGILNVLHVKQYSMYHENILQKVLGEEGLRCRQQHERSLCSTINVMSASAASSISIEHSPFVALAMSCARLKPRVLVTAPSNTAVDNIIGRIMQHGFRDFRGEQYFPNILRLGAGATSIVHSVTLEGIMDSLIFSDIGLLQTKLGKIKDDMKSKISEILHLQSLLLNMISAFNIVICEIERRCIDDKYASCDSVREVKAVPSGWELRVDFDSGQPYWVDHNLKATYVDLPHDFWGPSCQVSKLWPSYRLVTDLPEYIIFSGRLVSAFESLEICNLQFRRIMLYLNNKDDVAKHIRGSSVRQILEGSVIDEAHLVFTTLNGSGHPSLESTHAFPYLVVDEAGQCTEPSILIPFRRGCQNCILVGDPQQLPATVFSNDARLQKYDRSLLERLMAIGCEYHLLDVQYRMSPTISAFSSAQFYEGRIRDGINVTDPQFLPQFLRQDHAVAGFMPSFLPFMFIDLRNSTEMLSTTKSRSNPEEVQFCAKFLQVLLVGAQSCFRSDAVKDSNVSPLTFSVGVISPYAEQVVDLIRHFKEVGLIQRAIKDSIDQDKFQGKTEAKNIVFDIEINTVDGFQGREKDFILISSVRSNSSGDIGFLADPRRMNVAVTRARYGLFVVGSATTLEKSSSNWSKLVTYSKLCRGYLQVFAPMSEMDIFLKEHFTHGRSHVGSKHVEATDRERDKSAETATLGIGAETDDIDQYRISDSKRSELAKLDLSRPLPVSEYELEDGELV
jgi:hypothetical protein